MYGLVRLRLLSFYTHFIEYLNHKWVLYLVKLFSSSIDMIAWSLTLMLLMWFITLICMCWTILGSLEWTLLDYIIFLIYYCIQFAKYFVEDFCIYVHQRYWPRICVRCLWVCCLCLMLVSVMLASQNELGSSSSSYIFWKSLRLGIKSLNVH